MKTSSRLRLPPGAGGASPVLGVACPKCGQPAGVYCRKLDGTAQVISHRLRIRLYRRMDP